ncbi:hypothetical protein BJ165DRAFT_1533256 [Panaeolus papilionaceus]|nr:hypothetical protein BJ165DRAFT_1533256 [Panaeolus papilionaceus]
MTDNASKKYQEYQYLNISGPISVTPVVPGNLLWGSVVLILGPTGSGKSTFIEALLPDSSLQISSNQLEGFTQSIGTYKIENVEVTRTDEPTSVIYLVDVPGFTDTKISETSIVCMLREWMKVSPSGHLGQILYLTPIQSACMPGSHGKVLRTVQAMTGWESAANITIVTTMWDRLWSDMSKMRAESNFNELQDVIGKGLARVRVTRTGHGSGYNGYGAWTSGKFARLVVHTSPVMRGIRTLMLAHTHAHSPKPKLPAALPHYFMDGGGQIVKFYNNQDSVLSILNTALPASASPFYLEASRHEPIKNSSFGANLWDNLQSRIENLNIERDNLQADLNSPSTQSNETLKSTLANQLKEVERLLTKFTKELHDNFEPDDDGVGLSTLQVKINHAITSRGQDLVPSHQDVIPSIISRPEISAEAVPETGKVVRIILALKCWGADATRWYDD